MKLTLTTVLVAVLVVLSAQDLQPAHAHAITWAPSRTIETAMAKSYALGRLGRHEARCLNRLWTKESGWRYWADNPKSSAYGIAQVLNTPKHLTPYAQVDRGLKYIHTRYGSTCKAWTHWQRKGWY